MHHERKRNSAKCRRPAAGRCGTNRTYEQCVVKSIDRKTGFYLLYDKKPGEMMRVF